MNVESEKHLSRASPCSIQTILRIVPQNRQQMTGQLTIYFLHYWGTGPTGNLAAGFKAALEELGKHSLHTYGGRH